MVALFSLSLRSPPRAAASLRPRAAAAPAPAAARELRLPYDLREGQARVFHRLPSGLAMEAIVQRGVAGGGGAAGEERRPPLVFVHGSFHAAWCWAEHWMPYFSSHGYDCYALSLLGQGESDVTQEKVAGTLQTHTRDIYNFIHEEVKLPPVLIGHSFGGTIVQSYIAAAQPSNAVGYERKLAGAILLCSTPPSGNAGLVLRYLFTRPIDAIKNIRSTCALCGEEMETLGHLILSCCKSAYILHRLNPDFGQYSNILEAWKFANGPSQTANLLSAAWWTIWHHRNNIIFSKADWNDEQIINEALSLYSSWQQAF